MPKLRAPGRHDIELASVTPSYAIEQDYRRALGRALGRMAASYSWWIERAYEQALDANVDAGRLPDLAQDAAPKGPSRATGDLFGELARLELYWRKYFDKFARDVAERFVTDTFKGNTTAWQGRLRTAGFDLNLQLTPSQKLILDVKVRENVALIKSIAQDYHKDVEGIVSRNYVAGRDLHTMAQQIKARGNVSTNRAALIAKDQSNKTCAQMNSARQRELGIRWGYWKHSSAGKEPRPEHVRAGREQWIFDLSKGIDFRDKFGRVLPGEAINCRCTCVLIIPALGRGPKNFDEEKLEPVSGFEGAYRLGD